LAHRHLHSFPTRRSSDLNFALNGGVGVSGVNFFAVPGIAAAADRRDFVILSSLRSGLELLATAAFFGSANQNDYRWGRLHRIERSEEHTSELQSQSNLVC